MSQKTAIEWTDATWSPIRARVRDDAPQIAMLHGWEDLAEICEKMKGRVGPHCEFVSPGCNHCYSCTNNHRCLPGNGTGLPFDKRSRELVDIFVDEDALMQVFKWKKGRRIFVENQSDLFGEWVTDEMLDGVFATMALSSQHTYQVLTKRPERALKYIGEGGRLLDVAQRGPEIAFEAMSEWGIQIPAMEWDSAAGDMKWKELPVWPLRNVWLGVSVENQDQLRRVDVLKHTPAALRFISFEPLLEDLGAVILDRVSWAIIGGESGSNCRPCHLYWIRRLIKECRRQNVACFVKQWGGKPLEYLAAEQSLSSKGKDWKVVLSDRKGGNPEEWPSDIRIREFPEVHQ